MKSQSRISEALETLDEAANEYGSELRQMIQDKYVHLRDTLREIGPEVESTMHRAKERLTDAFERTREVSRDRAIAMARQIDTGVRRHPWASIGSIAAAGLVIGFFLGRR